MRNMNGWILTFQ